MFKLVNLSLTYYYLGAVVFVVFPYILLYALKNKQYHFSSGIIGYISLVFPIAARNIPEGKIIIEDDLTYKRHAHGISSKFIDDVVGKRAVRAIDNDEIIQWNILE